LTLPLAGRSRPGDIADRALVKKTLKCFNVQAVIHFAAHGYVGESIQQPRKYF
jgi:UDP-glucose 4-epimerase